LGRHPPSHPPNRDALRCTACRAALTCALTARSERILLCVSLADKQS
jgi:hypothetical protein